MKKSISFSHTAFYFICYPWQIVSRFSSSVVDIIIQKIIYDAFNSTPVGINVIFSRIRLYKFI